MAQNISSQIVQERETIMIPLGEYFKGSLLDYRLCIANRNQSEACIQYNDDAAAAASGRPVVQLHDGMDRDITKMVKMHKPYDLLKRQKLNDTSYEYALPPFPRSTYLMEDSDGTQIIYLVDRNY